MQEHASDAEGPLPAHPASPWQGRPLPDPLRPPMSFPMTDPRLAIAKTYPYRVPRASFVYVDGRGPIRWRGRWTGPVGSR